MTKLIPYLCCKGASAAIDFYVTALGATETFRLAGDDGNIGHATLLVGDDTLYLSDEWPEGGVFSPETLGGTAVTLHLGVDDVDAAFNRAVEAGAAAEREPADQFYGDRNAVVRDPFGHRWMLSSRVEDVSAEEMQRRAAAAGYATADGT